VILFFDGAAFLPFWREDRLQTPRLTKTLKMGHHRIVVREQKRDFRPVAGSDVPWVFAAKKANFLTIRVSRRLLSFWQRKFSADGVKGKRGQSQLACRDAIDSQFSINLGTLGLWRNALENDCLTNI